MKSQYGAAISKKQYLRAGAAAGVGSVLEWYDYTVLIALSPVIQEAFFPPGDLVAKQLSFWSVYAVGYLFRPLGSLLFGHICDVHGRRLSLMFTLIMMAVPTVLIGCLPTYAQAGLAAPILLSVLRLVQGVAVGGELGTAVVFMHELAPARSKTKGGSIIFVGVTAGILMGIIVAMIVNAAIPRGALLHWGWRVPFLIAILTAVAGLLLRYNMPESFEFEHDPVKAAHQARVQQYQQEEDAMMCSSKIVDGQSGHDKQQQQQELLAADPESPATLIGQEDMACSTGTSNTPAAPSRAWEPHKQQQQQQAHGGAPTLGSSCCPCSTIFGHEPVKMLFRDHWREVLLLFWFETWSAANFYVFYGWLPSYIATQWQVQTELTLGMTLVNMSITLALIPCAAHLADRGLPRLAATAVILTIATLCSVPMLLAISTRSMVAAWLMQMFDLFLNATIFGWLPTIGSLLFPVHVRATGYNFAHTAAQSWLGGLTPLIISALALRLQRSSALPGSIYLVTGLYLTVCGLVSLTALVIMWRKFPQTNRDDAHVSSNGSSSVDSCHAGSGAVLPVAAKQCKSDTAGAC